MSSPTKQRRSRRTNILFFCLDDVNNHHQLLLLLRTMKGEKGISPIFINIARRSLITRITLVFVRSFVDEYAVIAIQLISFNEKKKKTEGSRAFLSNLRKDTRQKRPEQSRISLQRQENSQHHRRAFNSKQHFFFYVQNCRTSLIASRSKRGRFSAIP